MSPQIVHLSAGEIRSLRRQFEALSPVSSFHEHPQLAAKVASYGIFREIGTANDELARFIFDADLNQPVRRESLKAELITWNNLFGVRIYSTDCQRLDLRTQGFYDVVHPQLSQNSDGTFHSLFVFPEIIARIAAQEGVDLVLVKSWGLNSIFGCFDPSKGYYQTNFWELENNDVVQFADLTRKGKIAFLGTHDLIAHIGGIDQRHWNLLRQNAQRVHSTLQDYFGETSTPSVSSLILPYTIGVVLDDLAQPPSYSSQSHLAVLEELLARLRQRAIPPDLKTMLTRFPANFQNVIELSRTSGAEVNPRQISAAVEEMILEILSASLISAS